MGGLDEARVGPELYLRLPFLCSLYHTGDKLVVSLSIHQSEAKRGSEEASTLMV